MSNMKKIGFAVVVFLFSTMLVRASDDGYFPVNSEATLTNCVEQFGECRLTGDISLTKELVVNGEIVLDLHGYKITPDASFQLHAGFIQVGRGAKLTIQDSKGSGEISTGSLGNVWAAIQLIQNNDSSDVAELIVNGGTIAGYYYGITGNGKRDHTKVTINSGAIKCFNTEDCTAIFQPQMGELFINGGTITGGSGIEIRSGSLTIRDGVIKGLDQEFKKMANSSGTTIEGVGVVVAQHTTKQSIKVDILGGNIEGQYAFYEWNPQKNSKEDINQIHLYISGGNFVGLADGVKAIYSEDFTHFVSGGKFNTNVDEYLTSDADVVAKIVDGNVPEKKIMNKLWWVIMLFVAGSIVYFFIHKDRLLKYFRNK